MGRRLSVTFAAALLACALAGAPAGAVVGGKDAAPGAYPAVTYVTLGGSFACTGTLIAPTAVLSAGHCGSLTGSLLATPIGWPPSSIGVTIGAQAPGGPGENATVSRVAIPPSYLNTTGSDISLLLLDKPAATTPVRVAGRGEEDLWKAGVTGTIVGFGATAEGGGTPDHLQEANVPVVTDASCATAYSRFDARTMLCAGFPQGGVDSCQGDSGGPLFGRRPDGSLVVVGATSQGDGCARPGKPGVYARVAANDLREWIRSVVPGGVDADVTRGATPPGTAGPVPSGATSCASRRKVTVTVKPAFRRRVRTVVVLVAGKRVATLRGGRIAARVSFAGQKKGTVRVQLVMTLKTGKKVTDTRRFKVCGG
jgi:secreted trypsin-like serine protease